MRKTSLLTCVFAITFLLFGCKKTEILSSEKQLLTFSFPDVSQAQIALDQTTKNISVTFPRLTDVKALKPVITVSPAAMVSPASGIAQDFSKPVVYTVKAEDGTTQTYTVSSAVIKLSDKLITSFKIGGVDATIDQTAKTIKAELPAGTDLTKITPTITFSIGATISPVSGATQDFSKDVVYTVTAEDGSTQAYTVKVSVLVGGLLFVGNENGKLYACDYKTGGLKWSFSTQSSNPRLSYADGVLYIGGLNNIFALDVKTGTKKWTFDSGSLIASSPIIDNNIVYFTNAGGQIFALNASTGQKKWATLMNGGLFYAPTIANGILYVCESESAPALAAVSAEDGTVKWRFKAKKATGVNPAIANNLVYFGDNSGTLYAIDAITGTKKWESIVGKEGFSSPTISNGILYICSTDKNIYALNASTGEKKWTVAGPAQSYSAPTVANNLVYIQSQSSFLVAFNAITGAREWTGSVSSAFDSSDLSPVVVDGIVYCTAKSLFARDAKSGSNIWEIIGDTYRFTSSPCVIDKNGKVYHSGENGMQQ